MIRICQLNLLLIFLTILLCYSFITPGSYAQTLQDHIPQIDCSIPGSYIGLRPDPKGFKTPIKIGFHLIDLKAINDVNQSFVLDVLFTVRWRDPGLSEAVLGKSFEDCIIDLEDIWTPTILEVNRSEGEILLDRVSTVDPEGNVIYKQRFAGELTSEFDFQDFPFDNQILHFMVGAFGHDAENIVFELDETTTGSTKVLSVEGWNAKLLGAEIRAETIVGDTPGSDHNFTRIDFQISAERQKRYYIWKVIAPLCFIVLMAWAVFWIHPKNLETKIGLTTATIFTLIAYRFSISFTIPKVSYFTRLDEFVFFSTVLVFSAFGIAVITCKLASEDNLKLAINIEKWARPIYIFLFLSLIIFTLWL